MFKNLEDGDVSFMGNKGAATLLKPRLFVCSQILSDLNKFLSNIF